MDRVRTREEGFSLTELLVTILILGLVLGATISMLSTTYGIVPGDIEAGHTVEDAQTGINLMTRELRQATSITIYDSGTATAPGDQIAADFASGKRVVYRCDLTSGTLKKCTRTEGTTSGNTVANLLAATGTKVVDSISNGSTKVFAKPTTSDNFFSLTIIVKSNGNVKSTGTGHRVTFSDGFYVRNA